VNYCETFRYAQDETIFDQLVYGIRYLDIRVAYSPRSEPYQIVHSKWYCENTGSLKKLLQQVKDFLLSAPKEIVILDFHLFEEPEYIVLPTIGQTPVRINNYYQMSAQNHAEIVDIIKSALQQFIIPFNLSKFLNNPFLDCDRNFLKFSNRFDITYKLMIKISFLI
jgi:hypothetical protein